MIAKIIQKGVEVVFVEGETFEEVASEVMHYAYQYIEDGDIAIVFEHNKTREAKATYD